MRNGKTKSAAAQQNLAEESCASVESSLVGEQVAQNIETIAQYHSRWQREASRYQKSIEAVTSFLGRPLFFYMILVTVIGWAGWNVSLMHAGRRPWDPPPFNWLQGTMSLFSVLMTTVVLITQNRQGRLADRQAQLHLQISLLAEQKTAKLIALMEELRRDLPNVQDRLDPQAQAMTESLGPHSVLESLEETLERAQDEVEELETIIVDNDQEARIS